MSDIDGWNVWWDGSDAVDNSDWERRLQEGREYSAKHPWENRLTIQGDLFSGDTPVWWDGNERDYPSGDGSLFSGDTPSWWESPEGSTNWWDPYTDYTGGQIDLSNSDFMIDGSLNPDSSESSSGLGSLLKWLNGAAELGSNALILRNLYEDTQSNQLRQGTVAMQNKLSENAINSNNQNQYRAFTDQAGRFAGDAYTTGVNQQKMGLMLDLMKNNLDIDPAQYTSRIEGLKQTTDPYRYNFENLANDSINSRNAHYPDTYSSKQYFHNVPVSGSNSTSSNSIADYLAGVPEGTDPGLLAAYTAYLNGN